MVSFRWAALDDEPPALDVMRALMKPVEGAECVGCWTEPAEALKAFAARPPDLLFLDVEMPRLSGLEFLEHLQCRPVTALVTAHPQYAVDAFPLGVREYVLKPVSAARLAIALENLRPLLLRSAGGAEVSLLAFRAGHEQVLQDPLQIVSIEADGNFSHLKMADGSSTMVSEPLSALDARLQPFGFLRVHRSFIVNRAHIAAHSRSLVRLSGGGVLAVGRAYADRLFGR